MTPFLLWDRARLCGVRGRSSAPSRRPLRRARGSAERRRTCPGGTPCTACCRSWSRAAKNEKGKIILKPRDTRTHKRDESVPDPIIDKSSLIPEVSMAKLSTTKQPKLKWNYVSTLK